MTVRASDYPPPFAAAEFVGEPTDPADERIEVGVLIVGAGPAGLACAIRLGQLLEQHPEVADRLGDVPVALLEKGKQPGSHLLSGAVVNPRALRKLGFRMEDLPSYGPVHDESVYVLTGRNALRMSLRDLGYEPSDADLAECYRRVTALADQSKQVRQRDLVAIAHEVMRRGATALAKEASPAA